MAGLHKQLLLDTELQYGESKRTVKEPVRKDGYDEQLQIDSQFLCSDQRMDTELVDRLVLQLNRTYPQILTDREAQGFRDLSVPTAPRLAELLVRLRGKGEEACHEFYRGLQIHADEVYINLPTRFSRRTEPLDPGRTTTVGHEDRYVLNDRGPLFFLSCFSLAVGLALLCYYGEGNLGANSPFLSLSVLGACSGSSDVLLAYTTDIHRIH